MKIVLKNFTRCDGNIYPHVPSLLSDEYGCPLRTLIKEQKILFETNFHHILRTVKHYIKRQLLHLGFSMLFLLSTIICTMLSKTIALFLVIEQQVPPSTLGTSTHIDDYLTSLYCQASKQGIRAFCLQEHTIVHSLLSSQFRSLNMRGCPQQPTSIQYGITLIVYIVTLSKLVYQLYIWYHC